MPAGEKPTDLKQRWAELNEQRLAVESRLRSLHQPAANGTLQRSRPSEGASERRDGPGPSSGPSPRGGPERPPRGGDAPPGQMGVYTRRGAERAPRSSPFVDDRLARETRKRGRSPGRDGSEARGGRRQRREGASPEDGDPDGRRPRPRDPGPGGWELSSSRPDRPRDRDGRAYAPSRRKEQGVYEDSAVKARSRRLFGGLLGHLAQAKKTLEKDVGVLEKQSSKQSQADTKAQHLKREAFAAAKHACREVKYKELAARDDILTNLRKTEAEILHGGFVARRTKLKAFVRTDAEPHVFWLPKVHTDATRAALARGAAAIDAEIAARARAFEDEVAEQDKAFAIRQKRRDDAAKHMKERFTNQPGVKPPGLAESDDDDDDDRGGGAPKGDENLAEELAVIDDLDDELENDARNEPEPEILQEDSS